MSEAHRAAGSLYIERAERLLAVLQRELGVPRAERTVIAVAGESGSGKSVTAIDLAAVLNASGITTAIVHQDNYFIRPPRTNHEHRLTDIGSVGPQEVQLALIAEHMQAFREGAGNVAAPVVDYPGNRFTTQSLDFTDARVLVVEGTYALLIEGADIRIFLDATYEDTAANRRARNRDIDTPFVAQVLAIEHRIIAPQVERADIVIDRSYGIRVRPTLT
ncbi:MAG TPA: hypothetical protein VE861_09050 [Gemmatimonadaceae bacterium]|nr:hypothetical protein [Gemmatimonadaceae bacterium]